MTSGRWRLAKAKAMEKLMKLLQNLPLRCWMGQARPALMPALRCQPQ